MNQFEGWTNLHGLKCSQSTKDKDFQKGLWSATFGPPYSVYTFTSLYESTFGFELQKFDNEVGFLDFH